MLVSQYCREEGAVTVDFKLSIASSDAVVIGFSVLNIEEVGFDTIKNSSVTIVEARSPEPVASVEIETAAMSGCVLDAEKEGEDSTMMGSLLTP